MNANSAYHVERQLHALQQAKAPAKARTEFNPQCRPRVFDRLLRTGEPDIRNALATKSPNGLFAALVTDPDGELKRLLNEPFWRLLDPTPLSHGEITEIEGRLAGRRARKPLPGRVDGSWQAHFQALTQYEWDPNRGALPDAEFVCLTDALLEIHRSLHARDYARYCVAVQAAAELAASLNRHWVLRAIMGWRSVPGFEDFDLLQYIQWVFGTLRLPGSSSSDWKRARELLYRDGLVLRKLAFKENCHYYDAFFYFGSDSANKAAALFGWDTLRRGESVEDEEGEWPEG